VVHNIEKPHQLRRLDPRSTAGGRARQWAAAVSAVRV